MDWPMILAALFCLLASYGSGSVPFGYLIGKDVKGPDFDIRDWGSHNIGFSNVLRVLGVKAGVRVLLADIGKGFVPVLLVHTLLGAHLAGVCMLIVGIAHAWSIYFFIIEKEFSGGKSVATLFGGALATDWRIASIALIIFVGVVYWKRYISLGSIAAFLSAIFISMLFQQGGYWYFIYSLAALLVVYTHQSNINRLVHGTENKIGRSKATKGGAEIATSVFITHALTTDDFHQSPITRILPILLEKGVLSERTLRWIISKGSFLELDIVRGITTKTGQQAQSIIFGVPLLPDQIKDKKNEALVMAFLKSAAVHAQRRGAEVVGLGALLSTVGSGGKDLQDWLANERKLTIKVDNGAAFTAAATINVLYQVLGDRPLSECRLAVVGKSGAIGLAVTYYLRHKVKEMIRIGRDDDYELLKEADIVIFMTSHPEPVITLQNMHVLKTGAIVLDVAIPHDVADEVIAKRDDLIVRRCGLVTPPGDYSTNVEFHFGYITQGLRRIKLLPACFNQTVLLSITKAFEHISGPVQPDDIDYYLNTAPELGFTIHQSAIAEAEVFSFA